ncbi:hypothetical protein TIFTF001_013529 [Ficus carica]|uniref:Ubiquitin-like domain-containing protein n=1 Tax=Ficus carica TaxID=3494 RepID=A0AA88A4J0_FICCA|nr:hypothetical protein TIFTF001_013529 [Ficus carica]
MVSSSLTWSKLTVRYKGQELEDSKRLMEYEVSEDSEMEVRVQRVKRMKVLVQSKCETKKIPVWVNPSDNVEVLKPLLKKMNKEYDFLCRQSTSSFTSRTSWTKTSRFGGTELPRVTSLTSFLEAL